MSNTMINWRVGAWHLQVLMLDCWRWSELRSILRLSRNDYHAPGGPGRRAPGWRYVELYDGRRYALGLAALLVALTWWAL